MTYREPIAIVGMGGIFPGSPDPDTLWKHIIDKRDLVEPLPDDRIRMALDDAFDPEKGKPDKVYTKNAYLVDHTSLSLNHDLLKISPDLVQRLDPMFTLALYAAQEAFDSAVIDENRLQRCGIILGNIVLPTDASSALAKEYLGQAFEERVLQRPLGHPRQTTDPINATPAGLPAALIAKALGLGGIAFTLDAACASSLYALKLAADELTAGRADIMFTGGISRPDCLYTQMGFSQLRALSPSGKASPFDKSADGLVVGEGAGLFVLKRLSDALAAGDSIHAVIRGVGLSNDLDGSLLSPSGEGQLRAMRDAYEQAGWHPWDVDLIECHATGTPVGDRVEAESLANLWHDAPPRPVPCVLGSVKSNVGHLLTAAGAASLTRALLALRHKILPPTANFHKPIEPVRMAGSFEVLNEPKPWADRTIPRRAAVSAFGFGGINAHLLLEEWRKPEDPLESLISEETEEPVEEPIAVVGIGTRFGAATGIEAFADRVFSGERGTKTRPRWWGAEHSSWVQKILDGSDPPSCFHVGELQVPLGQFRIPPNELKEMLPQQLAMLLAATDAMSDAGMRVDEPRDSMGVFTGIALDLETTHYQLRWNMDREAAQWNRTLELGLSEQECADWADALRQAMGPALNANRVLGGLGSITASRIARELRLGGPSFTISSEETSGLNALATAVSLMRAGTITAALVGASDFPSEARAAVAAAARFEGKDRTIGDGAAALILKPLSQAKKDGHRIYAVIDEVVSTSGRTALDAVLSVGDKHQPGYLDLYAHPGQGREAVDRIKKSLSTPLGFANSVIGDTGALAGLTSLIKSCLALHYQIQPGQTVKSGEEKTNDCLALTRFWLRNRVDGPRRAAAAAVSEYGNTVWVSLEESEGTPSATWRPPRKSLVFTEGATRDALIENLRNLNHRAGQESLQQIESSCEQHSELPLAMAFLAETREELKDQIHHALSALSEHPEKLSNHKAFSSLLRGRRVFFSEKPIGSAARIAFVYPGSGSQFADMGRDMVLTWPEIARDANRFSTYLAEAMRPEIFWSGKDLGEAQDQHAMLLSAQVALGILVTRFVTGFGIKPTGSIGYSLGESTALLSLRAWQEPDKLHRRTQDSTLFHEDLAGPCKAVRTAWQLPESEEVDWVIGVVIAPEDKVRAIIEGIDRVYLLIVNTPTECVIGGQRNAVEEAVKALKTRFFALRGVVTVHCDVMTPVAEAYRNHHLFDTRPPEDVQFYSGGWTEAYDVNRESAADAVLAQAMDGVHFPKTIEAAYADGFNVFIEMGPGASCSRMINKILGRKPHLALSACAPGADGTDNALRFLGQLIAERIPLELSLPIQDIENYTDPYQKPSLTIPLGGAPFLIPEPKRSQKETLVPPLIVDPREVETTLGFKESIAPRAIQQPVQNATPPVEMEELLAAAGDSVMATTAAHDVFLRFSQEGQRIMTDAAALQMQLSQMAPTAVLDTFATETIVSEPNSNETVAADSSPHLFLDRDQCLEFATGSIATVLGPDFTEVDSYPTRVRLPDEPLMLVDRIVDIGGKWMDHGHVVTEHDVLHEGWYLDCGRIPTCIAIESGQADLFLSAYLGVDFHTKGNATYRLLDAKVTFHDDLPKPGKVIRYDIKILRFFRQADTHFFYFQFEGSVDGKPLLTMRDGCAGFFTSEELNAGKGVVRQIEQDRAKQDPMELWRWVPPEKTAYSREQLDALRAGDLAGCFGKHFEDLPINNPIGLPDGRMNLVHRVTLLDPQGGDYGLGLITAEADVHPGDWFLVCHFVDDQVMPGTLMYECCLHTLRVFLYRLGWVGERSEVVCQPVIGIASQLKCRGQVLESTSVVTYEVHIKEIGYEPEPYAVADALMYADQKRIVDISNMCIRFSGLDEEHLQRIWPAQEKSLPIQAAGSWRPCREEPHFSYDRLLAFALGKPSEAFGEAYLPFDRGRKIARFPNPPFLLMDRVVDTDATPFTLAENGRATVEYDVPRDAWFFAENRTRTMPYSILLEVALQSCGWLAAYMGSALHGNQDLLFRNLGGNAVQYKPVTHATGVLRTTVTVTSISKTRDVILEFFDFEVRDAEGVVFKGDTYFGFFTEAALANQVGVTDARRYEPESNGISFKLPGDAPFPSSMMRMLDQIENYQGDGGPHGLGFIRGGIDVDPDAWFFKAHFYQDPVWPGSLGIESFIQLLEAFAWRKWNASSATLFQCPTSEATHSWSYRGQVTPDKDRVTVEAVIESIDDAQRTLTASGFLSVDGLVIYHMKDFVMRLPS